MNLLERKTSFTDKSTGAIHYEMQPSYSHVHSSGYLKHAQSLKHFSDYQGSLTHSGSMEYETTFDKPWPSKTRMSPNLSTEDLRDRLRGRSQSMVGGRADPFMQYETTLGNARHDTTLRNNRSALPQAKSMVNLNTRVFREPGN